MADFPLFGSHKRYKTEESSVITWLKNTAKECGYIVENDPKHDQKGQKRKAGSATKQTIHWTELAGLAQLVASCTPAENIPRDVIQLLQDVIKQRKNASKYWKRQTRTVVDKNIKTSNEGHQHFISVLENVLSILKGDGNEPGKASPSNSCKSSEAQLKNFFDILELEETSTAYNEEVDDLLLDELNVQEKNFKPRKNTKRKKSQQQKKPEMKSKVEVKDPWPGAKTDIQYEAESDGYSESCFMIYCFFVDYNEIRDYMQERWCDYQDGQLSLQAVAVITNTASDIFQRMEIELISSLPRCHDLNTYKKMTDVLFYGKILQGDHDPRLMEAEDPATLEKFLDEANWLCLPVYWNLHEWLNTVPPRTVPIIFVPDELDIKDYGSNSKADISTRNWWILKEFLGECCMIAARQSANCEIPGTDELTRGAIDMLRTRHIPVWLVLAFQVYLDIRYILEDDVDRAHRELLTTGTCVTASFQDYLDFIDPGKHGIPEKAPQVIHDISRWITKDYFGRGRTVLRSHHGFDAENLEQYFFLHRHPTLCGLMAFRLKLTLQRIGLRLSSIWGSTITSLHLYNATRTESPALEPWMDMEAIIAIHGPKRIWKTGRPTAASEYIQSLDATRGTSATVLSHSNIYSFGTSTQGLNSTSVISNVFHRRYCVPMKLATMMPVITLSNLESLLNAPAPLQVRDLPSLMQLEKAPNLTLAPISNSGTNALIQRAYEDRALSSNLSSIHARTQFRRSRALTPLQVLDTLCRRISDEEILLNFNYLSMQKRSTRFLRALQKEFESELVVLAGRIDRIPGYEPLVGRLILELMTGDSAEENRVLERTAKIVKRFVDTEGEKEIMTVRQLLTGYIGTEMCRI